MKRLGVNIDHVATLRNARGGSHPNLILIAREAMNFGADSITIHLREDRRHIKDIDLKKLSMTNIPINLEIACNYKMMNIAIKNNPKFVCLVPEKRKELTTEGGINVVSHEENLAKTIRRLKDAGIMVSLFIDPDINQIRSSVNCGADMVELHTGTYANAPNDESMNVEIQRLKLASSVAHDNGLQVNAGHGITTSNLESLFKIPYLSELNVGHHLIAKSLEIGLRDAVSQFKEKMSAYRNN